MNCGSTTFAVLVCLLAGRAAAGFSTWDESQLQLLEQYSTPLRWYNIEGPPYWVAGPKMRHPLGSRLHHIRLQPGDEVTLRAPANSWLRLAGEAKILNPEDLEISVSTDARAFTAAASIQASDSHSRLIALPRDKPSLIRLTRPRQAGSTLDFAAWFSLEEPFPALAPYREGIRLPGKAVRVRQEGEALSQPAWLVKPEAGIEFPLEGPARVQLVARLPWPGDEPPREQGLVIRLRLDGADPLALLLSPELDNRHRTRVNHSTELVSDRMYGFLTVPAGKHSVRLQPTLPIYLSAFLQPQADFLLPGLNAPATNAMEALRSALNSPPDDAAIAAELPALPLTAHALVDQEQKAWRLARDNNPLDAGGQAADWLDRVGQSRRDYPAARRSAIELLRQRTVYREVLPARLPVDQPLRQVLFSPVRLRELFAPQLPIAVRPPTLEQVCDSLAEGHFAAVPPDRFPGLRYQLPPRSFDSRLRIAAMASGPARTYFFVQFDQEPPVKVVLDAQSVLPAKEFEPSPAFATLRVLEQEVQLPTNPAAGQPFGEFDLPLPVSEPGVTELPLPLRVRQMRIYQEPSAAPVAAAVAFRAAKPFELGEAAYLSLLRQSDSKSVLRLLANPTNTDPGSPEPLPQLANHFLPLIRLLQAHCRDFARSVDSNSAPQGADFALAPEEAARFKNSAAKLEKEGQLIEAVEAWNRLFWGGTAGDRSEAALAVMRDLESLGEDFLATQYARYALLTARAPQAPARAVAFLEINARQADDPEELEQLRAFLFMRCPCPQHLAGLVQAFALNARDEMVLFAGLLLPAKQRPADLMLAAALNLNWWQTFDRLVDELPEPETKGFWRAQKQLAFYHFAEAERELKLAGAKGVEMLRALQEGTRIRQRLAATDPNERLDAWFAWEQWQSRAPGPRTWRDAEEIVYQCSATELLFNCEQNRFSSWFRAEPAKPVTLRFIGPVRLQVEARPVLDLPFEKPVDDWLEMSEYGISNRFPICQCVPNPGLQLIATNNAVAGLKTTAIVDYGPGWHEVEVGLAGRAGLIRVLEEQPVLPLRILPALNLARLNLVLGTGRKPLPTPPRDHLRQERDLWWVPPEAGFEQTGPGSPGLRSAWGAEPEAPANTGLTDRQQLRLALRLKAEPESPPKFNAQELQALPVAEQWLAACRWKRWSDFTNWPAVPEVARANYLLATGRIRQVLDSRMPRDVHQRLITLLQVAEGFPAWRREAQCLAELLAAQTNCPPESKSVLLRLTQDLTWVPLPVSPLSAGIRPLQVRSDLPQDPPSRIRRALLPPAGTNNFTLAAQNAFTASMTLQHPAHLQISAGLVKAGFSPPLPLSVALQVDDLHIQHLPLTSLAPAAGTNFTLPEGSHLVRMWIEDPVVNQFVRLGFTGRAEDLTNSIWSQSLAEVVSENRFFHAATAAQPLRFSWKGPAWLRVDEWREGRFLSRFQWVQPGEQTVDVTPAPGRTESWYRIFVRATQTNQLEARPAWAVREPEPAPPPRLHLPESVPPSQARLTDYYRLGGQEDGTWTAGFVAAQRRPFELDGQQKGVVNKFVEADAAYLKLTPNETVWFSTEALGRVHRPGDVTLGLAEQILGRPRQSPLEWAWSGDAFAGSAGPDQQDIQAALHTAFEIGVHFPLSRKLDYYPFGGLFAHYLTLTPARAGGYDYIDQDLFTRFRYQHRWGGMVGNQLEYDPWLDTRLKAYLDLVSNENFTPDHWNLRFSWYQLFGPLRGEAAYRLAHFLADSDRASATFRQGVSASVYVELWLNGRHRLEVGGQFRHEWPHSGDSFFLVLSWDFSGGRGYRDFGPHEMVFRDLRSRRIPTAFNNLLQPEPTGASLP